jgi:hypothetical protein
MVTDVDMVTLGVHFQHSLRNKYDISSNRRGKKERRNKEQAHISNNQVKQNSNRLSKNFTILSLPTKLLICFPATTITDE